MSGSRKLSPPPFAPPNRISFRPVLLVEDVLLLLVQLVSVKPRRSSALGLDRIIQLRRLKFCFV